MAVTETQVVEALKPVEDPELGRSIVDLGMVKGVTIEGTDVTVLIALTVAGCPMRAEITTRVVDALTPVDGVERVKVDMTVMSPEELENVRSQMGASGGHGHGQAQSKALPFDRRTRVLAISSGKGGVGKSSVTVNLAVTLAKRGHEVGLLDADVYGFSVPGMLGVEDSPFPEGDRIVPPVQHGVRCMSLGFFVDDATPVIWRGPMLHKALEQFVGDVVWGNLDYLVIDMPPGTGDVAMSMAQYLPNSEVYVVTTPQPAAQRVAQRSGTMARQVNLSVRGVIENMSWFTGDDGKRYHLFGEGGGEALAGQLDVDLLGRIPLLPELREGGDTGAPIVVTAPDSEAAFAFDQLAAAIETSGSRKIYREELRVV
jgi:ATP-binding protein involved in chromosome partitioning